MFFSFQTPAHRQFRLEAARKREDTKRHSSGFDTEREVIHTLLRLCNWRPGDSYRLSEKEKLYLVFIGACEFVVDVPLSGWEPALERFVQFLAALGITSAARPHACRKTLWKMIPHMEARYNEGDPHLLLGGLFHGRIPVSVFRDPYVIVGRLNDISVELKAEKEVNMLFRLDYIVKRRNPKLELVNIFSELKSTLTDVAEFERWNERLSQAEAEVSINRAPLNCIQLFDTFDISEELQIALADVGRRQCGVDVVRTPTLEGNSWAYAWSELQAVAVSKLIRSLVYSGMIPNEQSCTFARGCHVKGGRLKVDEGCCQVLAPTPINRNPQSPPQVVYCDGQEVEWEPRTGLILNQCVELFTHDSIDFFMVYVPFPKAAES